MDSYSPDENDPCKKYFDKFVQWGLPVRGGTPRMLAEIEEAIGRELPPAFKAYFYMHQSVKGEEVTDAKHAIELQEEARELLKESGSEFQLPASSFVFAAYEGHLFFYFPLDGTEDPPVFRYFEGDAIPKPYLGSFSAWVYMEAEKLL